MNEPYRHGPTQFQAQGAPYSPPRLRIPNVYFAGTPSERDKTLAALRRAEGSEHPNGYGVSEVLVNQGESNGEAVTRQLTRAKYPRSIILYVLQMMHFDIPYDKLDAPPPAQPPEKHHRQLADNECFVAPAE